MEMQTMWGWQPALYLFLGGVGAGAFMAAGSLYFRNKSVDRRLLSACMWASLVCLGVGLLLLLSELTAPLRGLMMWQSFSHMESWMALGAWLAFSAMVVFFVGAVAVTSEAIRAAKRNDPGEGDCLAGQGKALSALVVVGMALAFGVAAYTGILLMSAPGVPLWNTPLLPCLFVVSAADTGVALVEIVSMFLGRRRALPGLDDRFLRKCVVALVAAELLVLAVFVAASFAKGGASAFSATVLVSGEMSIEFWVLFVVVGLVVPLFSAIAGLAFEKRGPSCSRSEEGTDARPDASPEAVRRAPESVAMAGAVCALFGGCVLRFLILYAGSHADFVASTLMQLPI